MKLVKSLKQSFRPCAATHSYFPANTALVFLRNSIWIASGERIRILRRTGEGEELLLGVLRRKATLRIGVPRERQRRVFELGALPPRSLLLIVAERADG